MTGQDAWYVYNETPRLPNHFTAIYTYDPSTSPSGPPTYDAILEHTRERLPLANAFRRKVVRVPFDLDHPYWVEDRDFDLEFHVRHIALPRPGSWYQLWTQVSRLHARPLDLTRPLWELYVIDNVGDLDRQGDSAIDGGFALVLKIHHSAIDGLSGVELLTALHDQSPEGQPTPKDEWQGEPDPSARGLLVRAGLNAARTPARALRIAGKAVPAVGRVGLGVRRGEMSLGALRPRTRFDGDVTAQRAGDGFPVPLGVLKEIKGAVSGATVNDVALAIVGGGLRAYLEAKGELPERSLLAGVPISVRRPDERGAGGNQVSIMVASLATDVADPLERLVAVHRSTSQSKALSEAIGARALADMSTVVPGGLLGIATRALRRLTSFAVNTGLTNVPGPRAPLYLLGSRVVGTYGMTPIFEHIGLIHGFTSYVDEAQFSISASREMLPDPNFYVECLERSVDELAKVSS